MALWHTSMEKTIAARSLKASHLLILGANVDSRRGKCADTSKKPCVLQ